MPHQCGIVAGWFSRPDDGSHFHHGASPMNASKENAREALKEIEKPMHGSTMWDMQLVHDFIQAACRKLPSEAAFNRDQKRSTKRPTTAKKAKVKR
jgi:hypothetical protein